MINAIWKASTVSRILCRELKEGYRVVGVQINGDRITFDCVNGYAHYYPSFITSVEGSIVTVYSSTTQRHYEYMCNPAPKAVAQPSWSMESYEQFVQRSKRNP